MWPVINTSALVYDRNRYFSLGPITKTETQIGRYCNGYRNYILKGRRACVFQNLVWTLV